MAVQAHGRSAALGFDDAYAYFTSEAGGKRGAVMFGDEMIDEASRKMALVISGKGRAAGMSRSNIWTPPED